jgi:LacI family transcriptional regulator
MTKASADIAPRKTGRHKGAPTISDVARVAQCSPMTVSRVINGERSVREQTREAVLEAIRGLNYKPNRAARRLAGTDQVRVALLYSNPSASYLSELLMGGLEQASLSDVHLVVERYEFERDEFAAVNRLATTGIEGCLLPSPLCDEQPLLDCLSQLGVSAVAIGSGIGPKDHSAVMIDEYQAAYDMTEHIIRLGHRKIGFITGNPHQTASEQRLEGFQAAMAAHRLDVPPGYLAQGLFSYRSGLDAAMRLLSQHDLPSAIFASNDDMAAATVAVAHRLHLDVPVDVSVCGFDDTAIASTIWPELTTIRQPIGEMSRKAIELLAAEIKHKRSGDKVEPTYITLGYELIRRDSDAAPTLAKRSASEKG